MHEQFNIEEYYAVYLHTWLPERGASYFYGSDNAFDRKLILHKLCLLFTDASTNNRTSKVSKSNGYESNGPNR